MQELGFRVWDIRFRIQDQDLGLGCRIQNLGFRIQNCGFKIQDLGFRMQDLAGRSQGQQLGDTWIVGLRFRIQDSGFRIWLGEPRANSWGNRGPTAGGHLDCGFKIKDLGFRIQDPAGGTQGQQLGGTPARSSMTPQHVSHVPPACPREKCQLFQRQQRSNKKQRESC